jgi:hypothetical protein
MDTPLLPDIPDAPEPNDRRELQPRYTARPDIIRAVAGAIALVGAFIGLLSRFEARAVQPHVELLPAIANTVYGLPSMGALRAATSATDTNRTVCVDQLRPTPSGRWRCTGLRWLKLDEIGAQAVDPGGPCTHREPSDGSGRWVCITRIPIPPAHLHLRGQYHYWFFGIPREGNGIDQPRKPIICYGETRMDGPHTPWRCFEWRLAIPGIHFLRPVTVPTDHCMTRYVDQETGVWSCHPTL